MVMDDIFGLAMSDLATCDPDSDNIFGFDADLGSVECSSGAVVTKNMDLDLNCINMEELDFDFEEMNDFGPWIETDIGSSSNQSNIEPEPCKPEPLDDRLNFKDLEITEAVRYDCMWSSYNEFSADTKSSVSKSSSISTPAVVSGSPTLNLSNSFYDSLLNSFDTPSCTDSDNASDRSDMDTDEDTEHSDNTKDSNNHESKYQSSVCMDHCYNISSTHLDNDKYLSSTESGPLTPPMSSDDEENSQQTNFKFNTTSQKINKCTYIRTKPSNINKSQSLLKKSYTKHQSSEPAKFSFKLNLKDAKNSRSLLKQRIQKVKIIKSPGLKQTKQSLKQKLSSDETSETVKAKNVQSAMRRRKERSLKMQEGEAREIHNQMERQRRNELKLSFDKLKTVLPELATSDKASKQQILDNAVETVKMIKNTEANLQNKVNSLSKSNASLKEKLRQLKADLLNSETKNKGIHRWQ